MHNSTSKLTHAQMAKGEHVWADPWSPKLMSRPIIAQSTMQVNSEIPLYKTKRMTYGYYLRANLKAAAVRLVNENVNKRTWKPQQQSQPNS